MREKSIGSYKQALNQAKSNKRFSKLKVDEEKDKEKGKQVVEQAPEAAKSDKSGEIDSDDIEYATKRALENADKHTINVHLSTVKQDGVTVIDHYENLSEVVLVERNDQLGKDYSGEPQYVKGLSSEESAKVF